MVVLGTKKGARNFIGFQAAEVAEGQRNLRVGRDRWVAAGKDQAEPVACFASLFAVFYALPPSASVSTTNSGHATLFAKATSQSTN